MSTETLTAAPEATADPSKTITIGTRRSVLARIQTDIVLASMQKEFPAYTYKVHAMDPLGDRDKITALYNFNAKSLWTEELEVLLDSGELDLIVHSLKGMLGLEDMGDIEVEVEDTREMD
jgi:hydroxymethylbilane synthase